MKGSVKTNNKFVWNVKVGCMFVWSWMQLLKLSYVECRFMSSWI